MAYLKHDSPKDEKCIFCAMVKPEDHAGDHVLCRGEHCFVTLNLYPYNNGHLMVVPYRHIAGLEDLTPAELTELMTLTQQALRVLTTAYKPDGFNIGINLGKMAGAGVAGHLHQHVVPRWGGDTNYMSVIGETRVIPEWIDQTYTQLRGVWQEIFPQGAQPPSKQG